MASPQQHRAGRRPRSAVMSRRQQHVPLSANFPDLAAGYDNPQTLGGCFSLQFGHSRHDGLLPGSGGIYQQQRGACAKDMDTPVIALVAGQAAVSSLLQRRHISAA